MQKPRTPEGSVVTFFQTLEKQVMAKQLVGQAKFQVPGGQATPAPPVGTSLGKFGINLGQFVQQFNDRTKEFNGTPIPVMSP